jgi:hypothetical protein
MSVKRAEQGLDQENRAYYMTISISRWFSVRLDFFGNLLILGIALFAAGLRRSVNPAKIGVVLSYTLGSKCLWRPEYASLIFLQSHSPFVRHLFISTLSIVEQILKHSGDDIAIC